MVECQIYCLCRFAVQNTISPHRNPVGRPRLIRPSPQPSTSTYHHTSVASEPPVRRARRSEPASLPVGVGIFPVVFSETLD
jgi:hypothetical protein